MTTTNTARIDEITTTQLHHARKGKAAKLASMLDAEYPALSLIAQMNEDDSKVIGWTVDAAKDGETVTIYENTPLPTLAEILEACEDADIDPEEGAKVVSSGSVVGESYRLKYAEVSSNGQTCGDWLAETLTSWTHSIEDGFDVEAFKSLIQWNGVDESTKWAKLPESGQKGWVGRYRMNGRQALEKVVALNGVIYDTVGGKHEVPGAVLTALRAKHDKWVTKQLQLIEAQKPA